ncbi:dihydrodipicolinate synthase family protein [Metallosphaera tengchongensis]|uniref:Dihydrodipicolinate synthase family protein n=1 Tax=Metallosphaera tengchongensis TaxID=1532350 RepID=A0A6N0NW62_9CREN|nr:dihydrodipicolinate synthase family protein [Metallosphaera tengchongensis]QKQ99597.1 dihydrodipicolinate synthase family protein [Metallosphaera tengchongensis]
MKQIIVANVTPFGEKGEVDLEALKTLYNFDRTKGMREFWVMGSTGECKLLSYDEKISIARTSIEALGSGAILGVNENSIERTVKLAKEFVDMGASSLFSLPPLYHRPSELGVLKFYEAISKLGVPVYVYNIPDYVGYTVGINVTKKLAAEGIIQGMKYTTNNMVSFLEYLKVKEDVKHFKLFMGTEHLILPSLMYGGDGVVTAVANFAPELVKDIVDSFESGNWSQAMESQRKVSKLAFVISAGDYPAGVKIALRYRGVYTGRVREPLQENINIEGDIYATLKEFGL